MFRGRLGVRAILILLVLISMAPVFVVLVWAWVSEQDSVVEHERGELRTQVRLRAEAQAHLMQGVQNMLAAIAHAVVTEGQTRRQCRDYLQRVQASFPSYAHLGFADMSGEVVCRSAGDNRSLSIADRSHFLGALRSGRFTVGEYIVSRLFDRPAIVMTLPVRPGDDSSGRWQGVQYALLDLAVQQQQFAALSTLPGVTELLTDARGRVLASAGAAALPAGASLQPHVQPLVEGDRARDGRVRDAAGRDWLYAAQPVPAPGEGRLLVIALSPLDGVLRPGLQRLQWLLGALLLIATAASVLAWRMGERLLAQPVQHLLAQVRALERDEPVTREACATVPELTRIGQGIADLAASLAARGAQRDAAMASLDQERRSLARSEQRYRMHFECSPQPMWVFDVDTLAFLEVNDAAVAHYGYAREEFMRMTLMDIRPPEEIPPLLEAVRRGGPPGPQPRVMRHRRKDGAIIHVEVAALDLDWDGRRARSLAVSDVTSRVEAALAWERLHETLEQQVAQRTRELAAANDELEAFSYSVSHDLRAPLQTIQGFCGALAERHAADLPPQARHYLERIRAGTAQMDTLIRDLLAFARTGRAPMAKRAVDLAPLARQVAAGLRQRFPQRQVALDVEEPLPAFGDPSLLGIVLENLLGNAWKFTGRTAAAAISLRSAGPGTWVVADNGAGFDPTYADKLFRPFHRLHSGPEFEGSGIGLSIVQRILERHGGHAWAESDAGCGARFFFRLPPPPTAAGAAATAACA